MKRYFYPNVTSSVIIPPPSRHNKTPVCHHPPYHESEQTLYVATCVIAGARFITWRLVVESSHLHRVGGVGEQEVFHPT